MGGDEALPASESSSANLGHLLAGAEQGVFYPRGGPQKIAANLIACVREAGGQVYQDIPVEGIVLDGIGSARRAIGVRYTLPSSPAVGGKGSTGGVEEGGIENRDVTQKNAEAQKNSVTQKDAEDDEMEPNIIFCNKSVISGAGVLGTFLNLVPHEDVSAATRTQLSPLYEARPKIYVVYWLRGSADEVKLSGSDYVEVMHQLEEAARGPLDCEGIAQSYVKVWSPSAKDPTWPDWCVRVCVIFVYILYISCVC